MRPSLKSAGSWPISVLELDVDVDDGFRKGDTSFVIKSDMLLLDSSEPPARLVQTALRAACLQQLSGNSFSLVTHFAKGGGFSTDNKRATHAQTTT